MLDDVKSLLTTARPRGLPSTDGASVPASVCGWWLSPQAPRPTDESAQDRAARQRNREGRAMSWLLGEGLGREGDGQREGAPRDGVRDQIDHGGIGEVVDV